MLDTADDDEGSGDARSPRSRSSLPSCSFVCDTKRLRGTKCAQYIVNLMCLKPMPFLKA